MDEKPLSGPFAAPNIHLRLHDSRDPEESEGRRESPVQPAPPDHQDPRVPPEMTVPKEVL